MSVLNPETRARVSALPRQAVAAALDRAPLPSSAGYDEPPAAAFVSIHVGGQLRGCIGTLERGRPLSETIVSCALSAAFRDPRFPPMTPRELDGATFEISVLGEFEEITPADPSKVEVGRHGLYVEQDGRHGLLLPQVAPEWGWDAETFLSQTCRKAGLPLDAWRRGARVWRFDVELISDGGVKAGESGRAAHEDSRDP